MMIFVLGFKIIFQFKCLHYYWYFFWNQLTQSARAVEYTNFFWLWSFSNARVLENVGTPLLSSLPGPLWPRVVAPDRVLSMGWIKINGVFMLNWNVWNRTVFDIETAYLCYTELFEIKLFLNRTKLCTYAKANCLKWNCFCPWNCIIMVTELFDIELFWHLLICTYLYLYRLSPWLGWTSFLPSKCLLEKTLWDLIEGRVPSPTQKNTLFATDFPQTHWQSDPRPSVAGTDTSWIFTRAPLVGLWP